MTVRAHLRFVVLLFALLGLDCQYALGQASFPNGPNPHAVPTFHSIGLYWHNPGGGTGTAMVEFKEQGSTQWRRGLDLWYDARNLEYRGSLVELQPGKTYDIRITREGSTGTTLTASTWSESFPVPAGHEVTVPAGTRRIVVNPSSGSTPTTSTSGTTFTVNAPTGSGGFTRITAPAGQNEIVGDPASNECIRINHGTRNVIITGLVIRDCTGNGINLVSGSSTTTFTDNIVIDRNEFFGWGGFENDFGAGSQLADNDGAIRCHFGGATVPAPRRIIMQGNVFRDPRHGTNHWHQFAAHAHPEGPMAYYFASCGGNHVFRYNDVHADGNGNHFKDGVGSCCNDNQGGPGPDSDIYANSIRHVFDDAIQAEGESRNVRIWGNYIDHSFVAIANVPATRGPLYVWRNISDHMALMHTPDGDSDTDQRHDFVKGGDDGSGQRGRAYYFHNTILQPPPPAGKVRPLGAGAGLTDVDGNFLNFVSKNNIWHIYRSDRRSISGDCNLGFCESNFDLYNGSIVNAGPTTRPNGESWSGPATPIYQSSGTSYPNQSADPGNFSLASTSPGRGQADPIFNFNDQHGQPDIGAHQSGTPNMRFGRAAMPDGGDGGGGNMPAFRSAAAGSSGSGIVFRASASAATNASPLTIARPAGTVTNDVMIAAIGVRPSSATIATPAGWTLIRRVDNANGGTNSLAVFRKVAGSTEPDSYAWDVSGSTYATGGIQSFMNVDTTNPIDVENGQATAASLSHATPSVTTTVPNAMVVTAHTFGTSTTWTPPSGMTEGFDTQFQPAPTNSGQSIEGNYAVQATAGATGTKTATAAGGAGAAGPGATHILGLRPAP